MSTQFFLDSTTRIVDNGDNSKQLAFEVSGVSTATTRTLTVPNASGTIWLSGNNTDAGFTLTNSSDATKIAAFSVAGLTPATTRTYTFPDSSGTILISTNNLSGLANVATARTNLGLGTASVLAQAEGAEAALTNIVWTGTTAPTTPTATVGRWYQIGKLVVFSARLEYGVAGVALTALTFDLPAGAPAPGDPTGTSTNEFIKSFSTNWGSNGGSAGLLSANGGLVKTATGYTLVSTRASSTPTFATVDLWYLTA